MLGMPEIEIEIKSILPWESAVHVVDGFQQGRVFLAGDVAHQMPPWGGQGANTGVQDVHNLAWKLAAVLKSQASPELLTTYDIERRLVGSVAAEESGRRADELGLLLPEQTINPRLLRILSNKFVSKLTSRFAGQQFFKLLGYGYQYHSQVIIPEKRKTRPGSLDGRPGTRAPHAWVEYQGKRISTLDLFGTSFVLLAGSEGTAWCEAARATAARQNIDLVAYSAGPKGDLRDPESRWQAKAGISANGALLVRPDGFVAWRASEQAGNLQQKLEQVLKRALGQVPAGA